MKALVNLLILSVCLLLFPSLITPPQTVMGLKSERESFAEYVQQYKLTNESRIDSLIAELNLARKNPAAYGKQIGVDLSNYPAKPALIKSELLCKVAAIKAEDMEQNDYFDHIDKWGYGMNHWVTQSGFQVLDQVRKNPRTNYLESCNYNTDPLHSPVKDLIIDDLEPTLGHRKHLLSAPYGNFPPDTHVGIGISGYNTVVLITTEKDGK